MARIKPGLPPANNLISSLALPNELIFPLLDYNKRVVKPEVVAGQVVRPGDSLASGVIASAHGTISAIKPHPFIHPSNKETDCVVLEVDQALNTDTLAFPSLKEPDLQRIRQAGIAGQGGAGFDTFAKISKAKFKSGKVETLVINAVECEPLISCDEALIRCESSSVIDAVHCMITITDCKRCVLAIEDDKAEAIDRLKSAIADKRALYNVKIELVTLSPIYPSGAERILVQRLTGQSLRAGQHASDIGLVCLNVATVVAAWRAQSGHPMVSRIVTIAGSQASNATNVRVYLGTSVEDVLRQTGNLSSTQHAKSDLPRIRAGGPLSGFDLHTLSVPITATTNCIALELPLIKTPATACIRCSRCSDVCPVNLVPQQLLWYAKSDDVENAQRFGLDDCIECGCCDIVCPSSIELTSIFRHTRSIYKEQQHLKAEAELARTRFEKHEQRVTIRVEKTRQQREKKVAQSIAKQDPVADAIARAKRRRNEP